MLLISRRIASAHRWQLRNIHGNAPRLIEAALRLIGSTHTLGRLINFFVPQRAGDGTFQQSSGRSDGVREAMHQSNEVRLL